MKIATYSLAAVEPETGTLAVATASNYLSVGALVPWIDVAAGLVVTQSVANPQAAKAALATLSEGGSVEEARDVFLEDDKLRDKRQLGIMNLAGEGVVFSGSDCEESVESRRGEGYLCIGNMLVQGVVDNMAHRYELAVAEGRELPAALLDALHAGMEAGGDKRGKLAASLLVKRPGSGYLGQSDSWIDLRVDGSKEPVRVIRELYRLHKLYNPDDFYHELVSMKSLSTDDRDALRRFHEAIRREDEGLVASLERNNLVGLVDEGEETVSSLLLENMEPLVDFFVE